MIAFFDDLVRSGSIAEIALVILAAEALVLVMAATIAKRQRLLAGLPNLAAGTCLLLALRAALIDASSLQILCWLSGAFVAHMADLPRRWRN